MASDDFTAVLEQATRELSCTDEVLGRHIAKVGPCGLERAERFKPFEALMRSVAYQQLNGKAASTILGRVKERLGEGRYPTPEQIVAARLPAMRACGLSRAKARSIKDLAAKTLDGTVPAPRVLRALSDAEIIERLTVVRGIGQWTVEMMLMFRLGRLDVLPVDDFGVRKGYSQLYRKREMVTPKQLLAVGERWRPWRSVAAWYFWRVLDG